MTARSDDFKAKTVDVTFEPGEKGPKSVVFDIVDDPSVELTENFKVSFASSSSAAVKLGDPATVNILDNDGKITAVL